MPSGSSNTGKNSPSSAAKSAKALKAAKSRSGGTRKGSPGSVVAARQVPWLTLGAVAVVLALIGGLAVYLVPQFQADAEAQRFEPSPENPDPSTSIEGVASQTYPAQVHAGVGQRVNYDQTPPFGGPHDGTWATCTGIVYPEQLRNENAVHSLEHGAVWITYDPAVVDESGVDTLAEQVTDQPFMFMSPYPEQGSAISVQGWGRQLDLTDPADPRIEQFISAVRGNVAIYPEPGATCDTRGDFDPANPPPADQGPAPADAVQMDGSGVITADGTVTGAVPEAGAGFVPDAGSGSATVEVPATPAAPAS